MSNYKDPDFWKRRLQVNSTPLHIGDQKLMMGTVFGMLEDLAKKVEELDAEVQSLRSKGTPRPRKVVEDSGRTPADG